MCVQTDDSFPLPLLVAMWHKLLHSCTECMHIRTTYAFTKLSRNFPSPQSTFLPREEEGKHGHDSAEDDHTEANVINKAHIKYLHNIIIECMNAEKKKVQ